ncbi:hypothetical protein C1H46_011481 [Malus baccata]|uniref:Uncharacterized protein n=1 Tax=Malus baccata TaxID=106549 RepID=A0A540MXD3_MALBA|nr:hypothetical protein C1H46_011481 [Malus baccata]
MVPFSSTMQNLWTTSGGSKEGGCGSSRDGARVSFMRAEKLKCLSRLDEAKTVEHVRRVVVLKKSSYCDLSDQCFPR